MSVCVLFNPSMNKPIDFAPVTHKMMIFFLLTYFFVAKVPLLTDLIVMTEGRAIESSNFEVFSKNRGTSCGAQLGRVFLFNVLPRPHRGIVFFCTKSLPCHVRKDGDFRRRHQRLRNSQSLKRRTISKQPDFFTKQQRKK